MPNMYTPCDEVEFKLNRAIEEEAKSGRESHAGLLSNISGILKPLTVEEYDKSDMDYIHACALTDDARRDYNALPGVKHSR